MLLLFICLLFAGCNAEPWAYDYSATIECLADPLGAQYSGGMVRNAQFDDGLEGWNVTGNGKIEVRQSCTGNNFIVLYNKTLPSDTFSQGLFLQKDIRYTFSAWVQVTQGEEEVIAKLDYPGRSNPVLKVVGSTVPQIGCWSMIKGGITLFYDMQVRLYFETNSTGTELWVDSVSVQPFTKSQWRQQQEESIEKIRKGNLRVQVLNKDGAKLQGANIILQHKKAHFPIGGGVPATILDHEGYQKYFASRFSVMNFNNEMKWYFTEPTDGKENYTITDAMVAYAEEHGLAVRGHNVFWANEHHNPDWVKPLQGKELFDKYMRRIRSVMGRYKGRIIGWDVINENIHYHFPEERMGPNASAIFFKIAQELDPNSTMFLNEFNTLEWPTDMDVIPSKYVRMFQKIRSFPGNENMVIAIGLQGHFGEPSIIPYIRACLDIFNQLKMPIWITELTVGDIDISITEFFEEVMREFYSHSGIEGIIVWAGWHPICKGMCLTDNNFNNLPLGDVLDKLQAEWKTEHMEGATDVNGVYAARVFKGTYCLIVKNLATGETLEKVVEITSENNDVFIDFRHN